jgi:predicted ATPase
MKKNLPIQAVNCSAISCEVTGLSALNIFFGKNNSGKTAILDEIYRKDPQQVNYVDLDVFTFLYSDQKYAAHEEYNTFRQHAREQLLFKFNQAVSYTQKRILSYFEELTGLTLGFKQAAQNHFIQYTEEGEQEVALEELGNAYMGLMAILVELLWNERPVLLIDEPEIGLHADMQKRLFRVFKKLSKDGYQIFIATHSHLFIDKQQPHHNFRVKRSGNDFDLHRLETQADIAVAIYNFLGSSPADLMMPSNFIIVEGESDKRFLLAIMRRFYADQLQGKNIIIQTSKGDVTNKQIPKTLTSVEKMYTILEENNLYKDRAVVLVDKQDPMLLEQFREKAGLGAERLRSTAEVGAYALEQTYPHEVLKRIAKRRKKGRQNPQDIVAAIMKNKGYKKVDWARRVGNEIKFNEIPQIFKDVIEKAIELSL